MIDDSFVSAIKDLAVSAARPPIVQFQHRSWMLDPSTNEYDELVRHVKQEGTVSNVESLIAVVKEEAIRREKPNGMLMTVTFDATGAVFCPDDSERLDAYTYRRVISPEWELLTKANGKPQPHKAWIRFLQTVASVMGDSAAVIDAFRSIDVSRITQVASSPTLRNGHSGATLSVATAVNVPGGGTASSQRTIPSELSFSMPYARGGARLVNLFAEIDAELVGDQLHFSFFIADIDAKVKEAREGEVQDFRLALKDLPRLLILENF